MTIGLRDNGVTSNSLFTQPFLAGNPGLPEQPAEKSRPNIPFVFVRNNKSQIPALHLGVFATGERPFEAKLTQSLDELAARNRSHLRNERRRRFGWDSPLPARLAEVRAGAKEPPNRSGLRGVRPATRRYSGVSPTPPATQESR